MSKLSLFAVGGSGTRVLNSLLIQLAAGIEAKGTDEIIPVIIDTDINNGDFQRFRDTWKLYNRIHNTLYAGVSSDKELGKFFRTCVDEPLQFTVSKEDETLGEMLGVGNLGAHGFSETKLLIELLFDGDHLAMDLENGFLGNPNVGSIVLKKIVQSKDFKEFSQSFTQGDKIFIINSIFGGTGAAGYPLLSNIFRDPEANYINNIRLINNAPIGALTILPYFEVDVEKFQSGDSVINSNTFLTKTKAALDYYGKFIDGKINEQYYIGDCRKSLYENVEGGIRQKNPSNFVEFASALSIIDFLNRQATKLTDTNTIKTNYYEFGIEKDSSLLNFDSIKGNGDIIDKQLISFMIASVYLTNFLKDSLKNSRTTWVRDLDINRDFERSDFISSLKDFSRIYFYNYLKQLMSDCHTRKFQPFNLTFINTGNNSYSEEFEELNLTIDNRSIFNLVHERTARVSDRVLRKDKIVFDDILTQKAQNTDDSGGNELSREKQFVDLLYEISYDIYNSRFKSN